MFKRAWILGWCGLLAACGGGGGGSIDVPVYQASSPGQGNVAVTTVDTVASGLVAPQFMVFKDGFLYVADRTTSATQLDGTVRKIDATHGSSQAIGSVQGPVGVAFDASGNFFVTGTNPGSWTGLMSMRLSDGQLTNKVVGTSPSGVVFDLDSGAGAYGYFVDGSGKVVVLTSGFVPVGSGVSIAGTPNGLAYAGGYVYVTRYDGAANGVSRVSTTGSQSDVFANSTFFNGPTAIAVRTSPLELYVVNTKGDYSERSILKISADGSVSVFLSAQNTQHKLCAPGGVAIDNTVTPAVLYIANGSCAGSTNAAQAGKVLKVVLPAS